MKIFLIRIIVFISLFFVIEKCFYFFIHFAPKVQKDKRLELVLKGQLNKELYIIGSSRAARNIIASQIEDSLNIPSYNLGYPASSIEFHEFILRGLIKFNKKPKIILLTIDDHMFKRNTNLSFRKDALYPLTKYEFVNNEMINRGDKNFLSKYFAVYRGYKSNIDLRKQKFSSLDSLKECGSMPISFKRNDTISNYIIKKGFYDINLESPTKVAAFLKFQELCITKNIKLFLVHSPNLSSANYLFEDRLKFLSKNNVNFLYFDENNVSYKDGEFYYDISHLQTKGAIIFTNDIISQLKKTGISSQQ